MWLPTLWPEAPTEPRERSRVEGTIPNQHTKKKHRKTLRTEKLKEGKNFIYHILSNANEIIDTLTDHDYTDMEFVVVKNLTKLTVSPPKAYPVVIDWEQRNENFEKLSARITGENRSTIAILMDGQSKKPSG